MQILLFDTSIWIDYLSGQETSKVNLLDEYLLNTDVLQICPPIIQEILQGIRQDEQFSKIKKNLDRLLCLQIDAKEAAFGAAELYRNLRKKGITIRKPNDCLIAFYAISFDVELRHKDSDFDLMIDHTPIKIYQL
jgi:predicted nucleic acid-binding protein